MIDSIQAGVKITPQKKVHNNNIAFSGRVKKEQNGEILELSNKKKKEKKSILSKIGNFFAWVGALAIGISGALLLMVIINSKSQSDKKPEENKPDNDSKEQEVKSITTEEQIVQNEEIKEQHTEEPPVDTGIKTDDTKISTEDIKNETKAKEAKINRLGTKEADINFSLDIADEILKLIDIGQLTNENIQKIINEKCPNLEINIKSMTEYLKDRPLKEQQSRAATVRPKFDDNLKLTGADVFLPELNTDNKEELVEYLDKFAHEFTHIGQYAIDDIEHKGYIGSDASSKFMNFAQKKITDFFSDKLVPQASVSYIKEIGFPIKGEKDFDKFLDTEAKSKITKSEIGDRIGFGESKEEQGVCINAIFDELYDKIMESSDFEHDQNITNLINQYGGYGGLREELRALCAERFREEENAYKAGQIIRQNLNNTTDVQTYNEIINLTMSLCADALEK